MKMTIFLDLYGKVKYALIRAYCLLFVKANNLKAEQKIFTHLSVEEKAWLNKVVRKK